LLFVLERRRVRDEVEQGASQSAMSANLLLVLGALFLTVLGGFALQPMIQAAKAGEPAALSFAALHGISASLYWLKALLVLVLAWRTTAR
jgi:ABC-type antimicrobial peptide transport system permease subunit